MASNNTNVVIENTTQEVTAIEKLDFYTIVDKDGDGFTPIDILNEAEEAQGIKDQYDSKENMLNYHLVLLAKKCGKESTFRAVLAKAEDAKKWGMPPAGSPAHIRNQYHAAPDTYTQFKSKMLRAMKDGIMPMQEVTLTRKLRKPNKQGQSEVQEVVVLDSVQKMIKARSQLVPETASKPQEAGVVVDKEGNQKLVGKSAIQQAPKEVTHMALAERFAMIALMYTEIDEPEQMKALRTLDNLIKRMETQLPEVQAEADKVVNG